MNHFFFKFFLILVIALVSCTKNESVNKTSSTLQENDSLSIIEFFDTINLSDNSDILVSEISQKYSGKTRHFFNVYKFRFWLQKGRLNEVDSVVHTIISAPEFDQNSIEAARYFNILGIVDAYQGKQEESVEKFKKAVVIFEKNKDYGGAATIYLNVSNIFLSRLDYQASYDYALKAAENYERKKDTLYLGTSLAIAAVSAINMKNRIAADSLAKLALELTDNQNNVLGKSLSKYALGEIELNKDNYDSAIDYFEESAKLAQKVNHTQTEIASLTSLSKIYLERGQYEKVITLDTVIIKKAELINNLDILYSLNYYVAQAYAELGKKETAYDYLKKSNDFFKEKAIADNAKALQELLVQYESEKKEKRITEQELKIQKQRTNLLYLILGSAFFMTLFIGIFIFNRKAQKLRLKQAEKEKENARLISFIEGEERERNRISNELHDGVAAMIGAVKMGMESLPLLSKEIQENQIKKLSRILENTHSDVRHMAHNLLPRMLEKEGLVIATQNYAREINETNVMKVHVQSEGLANLEFPKHLQLMLFRIIQELINNVIKHSQATEATIYFKIENGLLNLEVTDNGIGITEDAEEKSQGLYSIKQRITSIGGQFQILNKTNNKGTKAIVRVNVQ